MKFLNLLILTSFLIFNTADTIASETGPGSGPNFGTVVESIQAGAYVYIKLEEQGIWIAASNFPVSTGDNIQYSGGSEMSNFYSKTLERTFESVFFVQNAFVVSENEEMMRAAAAVRKAEGMTTQPAPAATPASGEIKPLKEGKTVADVFAEYASLKDQEVKINARVIKVSKNILGKNWITLQDGTGTAPDHKLVATSKESPLKGDLVVVTGTVRTDLDIGSGYKYKVLLEEAMFSPGLE